MPSTTPLTLSHNPTTITNAYSVSAAAAIYGPAPTAWSVTNTTTIQNTATTQGNTTTPAFGILLVNGGTIVNDAGAAIISGGAGVAIEHTGGTLVNSGRIASTGTQAVGAHRYIGAAVYDGLVQNEAGGTISGYAGVGLAAVYNAGSYGSAGSLTNAAGGVISGEVLITGGTYADGVIAVNGPATITNSGSIGGTTGIWLQHGGTLTNTAGAAIYGRTYGVEVGLSAGQLLPTTILNSGTITSDANTGITLRGGGVVSNASGGTINGYFNGIASAVAATVANAGTIHADGYGINLSACGTITNTAGAAITGYFDGIKAAGAVAITNAGTIASGTAGNSRDGVIFAAGTLDNVAGGTISGHQIGVYVTGGGTVTNAGTHAQFRGEPRHYPWRGRLRCGLSRRRQPDQRIKRRSRGDNPERRGGKFPLGLWHGHELRHHHRHRHEPQRRPSEFRRHGQQRGRSADYRSVPTACFRTRRSASRSRWSRTQARSPQPVRTGAACSPMARL